MITPMDIIGTVCLVAVVGLIAGLWGVRAALREQRGYPPKSMEGVVPRDLKLMGGTPGPSPNYSTVTREEAERAQLDWGKLAQRWHATGIDVNVHEFHVAERLRNAELKQAQWSK